MVIRNVISAALISGAMLVGSTATAAADEPNCTAGDLTQVLSGVNAGMSVYLFTHPDVNAFFTSLKGMSREEMRSAVSDYLAANPDIKDQLKAVRQPAADFRARCDATMPDDIGPVG
ncbi:heme-binding protein [Mycobacterium sp. shizuoka-1]|uniref:heme-binding protein n=1 Tax=Mycobacterium sp. shizuoka-1 TaxID=2039281 RepID=UPI000C06680E|nr:heme-binding protein [Mycobacterium sp. shizuoka-1]GAY14552.1 membrane protein [Mycobacterium sp. shizuoka-1]